MRLIKMPLKERIELGKQTRKRINNNFTLEQMVEKYNNLYSSCD